LFSYRIYCVAQSFTNKPLHYIIQTAYFSATFDWYSVPIRKNIGQNAFVYPFEFENEALRRKRTRYHSKPTHFKSGTASQR